MSGPHAKRRLLSTTIRLFDPRLASNRFVFVAFCGVLAVVFTVDAAGAGTSSQAAAAAIGASFSVFLAWAIARELDPDRPVAASAAAVLALPILLTGEPRLGAVVAVLFAVRILAGTTGRAPTALDLLWLPGVAAYGAISPGGVVAGLALAGALALGAAAPGHRRAPALAAAIVAAGAVVGVALARATIGPDPELPTAAQWGVMGLAAFAATAALLRVAIPTSRCDLSGEPLSRVRVRNARLLAVAVGALTLAWLGGAGIPALAGLWAAVLGVGMTQLFLSPSGGGSDR